MPEEIEEKKELLKREEIRTMGKDMARLREIEAQKERERIAALKLEEAKKGKPPSPPEIEKPKVPPETLIPKPLLKKPSPFKKVLVRGIICAVLLLIFGSLLWFFVLKKPAEEEEIITPEEKEEEIIEEPEAVKPEISAPSIAERILGWGYRIPSSPRLIDTIILHSSYNALGGDLHDIEKVIEEYKMYEVAPHYLLARNGTIYLLVLDKNIAYHAGKSEMPDGRTGVNNFSIGIEVIYTETEAPTETQYQALAQLVKYLQQEYNIPLKNILGHEDVDIAPPFKSDPWNFDWEYFESLLE